MLIKPSPLNWSHFIRLLSLSLLTVLFGCSEFTSSLDDNENVNRRQAPQINSFTASPASTIDAGEAVDLTWSTNGFETNLTLQSTTLAPISVYSGGNYVDRPMVTTVYTLTATNESGSAAASITVTVSDNGEPAPAPQPVDPPESPAPAPPPAPVDPAPAPPAPVDPPETPVQAEGSYIGTQTGTGATGEPVEFALSMDIYSRGDGKFAGSFDINGALIVTTCGELLSGNILNCAAVRYAEGTLIGFNYSGIVSQTGYDGTWEIFTDDKRAFGNFETTRVGSTR
jgi:hypothetical protein